MVRIHQVSKFSTKILDLRKPIIWLPYGFEVKADVFRLEKPAEPAFGTGRALRSPARKESIKSQIFIPFNSFPGLRGFSQSNVFYMRAFYASYEIVQKASGQLEIPPEFCLNIPWWHNIALTEKVKNLDKEGSLLTRR